MSITNVFSGFRTFWTELEIIFPENKEIASKFSL